MLLRPSNDLLKLRHCERKF